MRSVKYFIQDYEHATGDRLTDFRRHINSYLETPLGGGGQAQSMPSQDVVAIVQYLEQDAPTWDAHTSQTIKSKLGLPQDKLMPNEQPGNTNMTRWASYDQVRSFLLAHPQLRDEAFVQTISQANQVRGDQDEEDSMEEVDDFEEVEEGEASPVTQTPTPSTQTQAIVDAADAASSTNTTPDSLEDQERTIVQHILRYLETQENKKKQFKYFVLLLMTTKPKSRQRQNMYQMFMQMVYEWIQTKLTVKNAITVLTMLVQLYNQKRNMS